MSDISVRNRLLFAAALAFGVAARSDGALSVGQPADLKFDTIDGKAIDLQDYRGKVVVIDYFASYCPVCNREGAKKKSIADKYAGGVDFIGVAADKGKKTHKKLDTFITERAVTWPVTNDQDVVAALGVTTFSTDTIIDANGRVAWQGLSFDLEQHLQQTLKQTPPVVLPQKTIDAALSAAKQAKSMAEAGDLAGANRTLKDVPAASRRLGATAKALDEADAALHAAAAKALAAADAAAPAGDIAGAILSYRQIEKSVPADAAAKTAQAKLATLQRDPKNAKAFADVAADERAQPLLVAAQKSIDTNHKSAAAVQLKSLIRQYPSTPTAEKAKQLLATLEPATQPAK